MINVIVSIALIVIVFYALIKRSNLQNQIVKIQKLETTIDEALFSRYDTFTQLIAIMDKYMDTETTTFREVGELHKKALKAREDGDERTWIGDEDKIDRHVEGVQFAFEQHENLKNDPAAQQLFETLINKEGDLAKLKQQCNDLIFRFNEAKQSLLGMMITLTFSKSVKLNFEFWHVNADALEGRDKYKVD